MQTAQPLGYLIMEGNVIQGRGEPYFAVLKDGSYALRDAGADCSDVQEAISGPFFLVRGGQIVVSAEDTALMPRNSIGLKAAGVLGIPAAMLFWSFAEEILCALYPHLVGAELAQYSRPGKSRCPGLGAVKVMVLCAGTASSACPESA